MKAFVDKLTWNFTYAPEKDLEHLAKLLVSVERLTGDPDFAGILRYCTGGEGTFESGEFIQFWNIDDLIALNPYYDNVDASRDLFFFASDGSNFGYALRKSDAKIVGIDLLEIGESEPAVLAESFSDFLVRGPRG